MSPIDLQRLRGVDATAFVKHEIPTPAPDGAQKVFTVANAYESGTLGVHRDQLTMQGGTGKDFTETTSTTFTLAVAPDADEVIWVDYIKQ